MKLNKFKNLIVLGVIVLSFFLSNNVSAYYTQYYWAEKSYNFNQPIPCQITNFEANNANINFNEPVFLRWSTMGCNHVSISSFGNVAETGEATFYPSNDTTYTLTASNAAGFLNSQKVKIYVNRDSATQQNNYYSGTPTNSVTNNYYSTDSVSNTSTSTKTSSTVKPVSTINKTATVSSPTTVANPTATNNLGASAAGSNLTALSLKGSGSFMPSSIWQWLLVVALILIIIIIARTLARKPEVAHDPHGVAHAH